MLIDFNRLNESCPLCRQLINKADAGAWRDCPDCNLSYTVKSLLNEFYFPTIVYTNRIVYNYMAPEDRIMVRILGSENWLYTIDGSQMDSEDIVNSEKILILC